MCTVTHVLPTTCAIQNTTREGSHRLMHTIAHLSPCVRVSLCAADLGLSLQGQVGGIRPPLQCRVVVNWFWLRAKSPHRHLFVFSTRPEKETAFTQASHNMSNSLSEPVFGLNTGVNLSKHTQTHNVFPTISYNHGIIKKRKQWMRNTIAQPSIHPFSRSQTIAQLRTLAYTHTITTSTYPSPPNK